MKEKRTKTGGLRSTKEKEDFFFFFFILMAASAAFASAKRQVLGEKSLRLLRCFTSSSSLSSSVGFVGLGNMGLSMSQNLVKDGNSVVGYDLNESSLASLESHGGKAATSLKDLKDCDTVITMLPSTPHVSSVIDDLLGLGWAGALHIDSSTIDPIASRGLSEKLQKEGIAAIDAPVSGGVKGASSGTLTFMVGGSEKDLDTARHLLSSMGSNIIHCGDSGAGQSTKLCNNLAMAVQMLGVVEAMNMGTKLGLDAKVRSFVPFSLFFFSEF